jgi:hypothetical protein
MFWNLTMTRNGGTMSCPRVLIDTMTMAFAHQTATVCFQMSNEIASFHGTLVPTLTETCWPV